MNETRLNLIWALRDRMPINGIKPSHVIGTELLPDPPEVAAYQPDLLARSNTGSLVIGLAKMADEIDTEESAKQYRAFTEYEDPDSGELAVLNVVVDSSQVEQADAAIKRAGASEDRFFVQGVSFPSGNGP